MEDPNGHWRLVNCILDIMQEDRKNSPGKRTVKNPYIGMLCEHEFNEAQWFSSLFWNGWPRKTVDRAARQVLIRSEAINPAISFNLPSTATHFRVVLLSAAVDFEQLCCVEEVSVASRYKSLNTYHKGKFQLETDMAMPPGCNVFVAMGVEIYEKSGDTFVPFLEGRMNAVGILDVS